MKVYAQARKVDYADYRPGQFYISPFELYDVTGRVLIESLRRKEKDKNGNVKTS